MTSTAAVLLGQGVAQRVVGALLPAALVSWTIAWWVLATAGGHHRDLTWWSADLDNLYAGGWTKDGYYGYSPAFVQILAPLRLLPWDVAIWIWGALMLGSLAVSAGRWTPLVIMAPPVIGELIIGNVHLLYAAAIVLGFRWPATWALMLLTKVTPGVGLLWFAVRREWRSLAIALGVTLAVAGASLAIAPGLWFEWLHELQASSGAAPLPPQPNALFPVPLLIRLPLAAAIVIWGARGDRRWTLPIAVTVAMPVIWTASLSVLVAIIALRNGEAANSGARAAARA